MFIPVSTVLRLASVATLLSLISAPVAAQDITVGGDSRFFAMGGAGLALRHEAGQRVNPASLAFEKGFGFNLLSLGVRTRGAITPRRVQDTLDEESQSSDNENESALLRNFVSEDSELGLVFSPASLRFSIFEVSSFGAARGRLQPNETLRQWAATAPAGEENVAPGSRSDLIVGGYTVLPAISAGFMLPIGAALGAAGDAVSDNAVTDLATAPVTSAAQAFLSQYHFAVGGRLKFIRGYFGHYTADESILNDENDAELGKADMNGEDFLEKSGVAADLGFLMTPKSGQGLSAGLVVANLVKPNLTFDGTDRFDRPTKYNLLATTISAGAGFTLKSKAGVTTLAADLVDITGAARKAELRFGGEQRFGKLLAVRAGYSSANGFSYGLGLWGFGVAIGDRQPLEVVQTLKF